jgi:hypothetical protein
MPVPGGDRELVVSTMAGQRLQKDWAGELRSRDGGNMFRSIDTAASLAFSDGPIKFGL